VAYGYDAVRRPTDATFTAGSLAQTYDRDGNTTSESRSLAGVSGDAGANTQSFSYDGLDRVIAADGLADDATYAYDHDGNRVSKTVGGVTTTYAYDLTGQLIEQTAGSTTTAFAYSSNGELTAAATDAGTQTLYAYDTAGRTTTISPTGADATSLTYDALGRVASSTTASVTTTLAYLGTSGVAQRLDDGTTATDALLDPAGGRLAIAVGANVGWSLDDLHGNLVAMADGGSSAIDSAVRYDAWGESVAVDGAAPAWGFQGRLDLDPAAADALYDFGARMYAPALGAFTAVDSYAGQPASPLSLNRFLYAHANPWTLVDPTGHCIVCGEMIDGWAAIPQQNGGSGWGSTDYDSSRTVAGSRPARWNPGPAVTSSPGLSDETRSVYTPRPVNPYAPDFAYEQLLRGSGSRTFANDVWDWTFGQGIGAVQGGMIGTLTSISQISEFAWSSTATLAYDREAFVRQWETTATVGGYIVTHIPETAGGFVEGTIGRGVELVSQGQAGYAAGELGLFGFVGSLRRGAVASVDDVAVRASSNAARRDAMRQAGIPTSQTPARQFGSGEYRSYLYEVAGRRSIVISSHAAGSGHPLPHWHAGAARLDDAGQVILNKYGAPRYMTGAAGTISVPYRLAR
jgi:RHS repeat-associated protein